MKIKTSELIDTQLDWAVAKANGATSLWLESFDLNAFSTPYEPSTDWSQGGPIIDREKIRWNEHEHDGIYAWIGKTHHDPLYTPMLENDLIPYPEAFAWGPTLLIAAMRCYVESKLGDEVDIPDELV